MSKVAVVILNWNGRKFLEEFLPSVIEHSANDSDIIIADNASTDDSVDFLEKNFPQVKIIVNDQNYGFAEGYNMALAKVEAEYFILLNSDIEVTSNWINPVIELMDNNPDIGACQPKIRSFHDRDRFEYAGASGGYIDRLGYPFCRGRIFQFIEKDHGQYDDNREVFWATGACLFVRAELFMKYGGFDSDFFAHMEEIDFCWRLKNYGYKIFVCPASTVYHIGGGTLPKASYKKTYLNFRNNLTLLYKNLPNRRKKRVFLMRCILDGIASFKFLLEGHIQDFYAVSRAYGSFYRTLYKTRLKRKKLIQNKVSMIYSGSIVVDHYIRKVNKFSKLNQDKFSK